MDQQEAEFSKNRKTNFKALPYFASMIKEIHVYQVSSRRQYGGSSVDFINWSTTARGEAERKEARIIEIAYMREELKQREIQIEELEARLRDFESNQNESDENTDKLYNLYQMCLIDINGNPIDNKEKI